MEIEEEGETEVERKEKMEVERRKKREAQEKGGWNWCPGGQFHT